MTVTVALPLSQVVRLEAIGSVAVEWHCPLCEQEGVAETTAQATGEAVEHLIAAHQATVAKDLRR